jgi:hypothetical protein
MKSLMILATAPLAYAVPAKAAIPKATRKR